MCTINRINHLKDQAQAFYKEILKADPLKLYQENFVSASGLTYSDLSERLDKIKECASIIELKETWTDDMEQVLSVAAANYCKQHTICPICSDRLQSRRRAIYDQPIRDQASQVKDGHRYAYMLTYTVTDDTDLAERLEHLKDSRRNWRLMGQRRGEDRSKGEASAIRAGISSIEITRGLNSGEWHVHAHELVFTDRPLDYTVYDPVRRRKLKEQYGNNIPKGKLSEIALKQSLFRGEMVPVSKISDEWLRATGGDSISLSVEHLQHVPKKAKGRKRKKLERMSFEESIAYQAREVIKYLYKPGGFSPLDAITILTDTYNKRMTATYGEFRKIDKDPYDSTSTDDDSCYVMMWGSDGYGDPVPGRVRDLLDDEHDTRSKCGKITGEYRRNRRKLIEQHKYRSDLGKALDKLKAGYRSQINAMWALYRKTKNAEIRHENANCDNYNGIVAANGYYFPGLTNKDLYAAAFT